MGTNAARDRKYYSSTIEDRAIIPSHTVLTRQQSYYSIIDLMALSSL